MLRIRLGFAVCALLAFSGGPVRAANTATMGMEEGDPAQVECPGNHYLAGVSLWWGNRMSGLSPYCVAMAQDGAWQGGAAIHLDLMMSDAVGDDRRLDMFCPRDFYIFGFKGHSHVYGIHSLMQLTLTCRNVQTGAMRAMATPWPDGVAVTEWPGGQCADNAVADGVFGNVNSARIIRFGLTCAKTRPAMLFSEMVVAKPDASLKALAKKKTSDMVQVQPGTSFKDAMKATETDTGLKPSSILQRSGDFDVSVLGSGATAPEPAPAPAPAALPAAQTFAPPLVPSGLRLYACETLDGDVCEGPVADMFCKQQGFVRTDGYDTGRTKGPVETITGQKCTKKKCKVFDEIVCVR